MSNLAKGVVLAEPVISRAIELGSYRESSVFGKSSLNQPLNDRERPRHLSDPGCIKAEVAPLVLLRR